MHSNYDGDGFLHGLREKKGGGAEDTERKGERKRGIAERRVQKDRSTAVHPARRVYKLSNLVDKSVPGVFFVPSGCPVSFSSSSPCARISMYACRSILANDNSPIELTKVYGTFATRRVLISKRIRHASSSFVRRNNKSRQSDIIDKIQEINFLILYNSFSFIKLQLNVI